MEKQTLGEIASRKLLKTVRKDNYTTGDKLPAEVELVELLGVSRNTMQKTLRILISRNIITICRGSDTFVSDKNGILGDPLGFATIEDRRKLIGNPTRVRVVPEPPVATPAAQNATEGDIREPENVLLGLEGQIIRGKNYSDKNSQSHTQITNCSHNLVMTNPVSVITDGIRVFAGVAQETEYEQTLKSHHRIFKAIRDKKLVKARQTMYFRLIHNNN